MQYSKQLNELKGTPEQQIAQLRNQLQLVQEETEDYMREMDRKLQALQEQIAALKKEG